MEKKDREKMNMGLALVMTLALMISMMLTAVPISALADSTGTGITLGTGKIAAGNKIWFGSYNNLPVLWRVLGNGTGNTAGSGMLLISNDTLATTQFKPDTNSGNQWQGSSAQTWCTHFYNNWPSGIEKNAILATSVSELNNRSEDGTSYYYKGGYSNYILYGAASLENEYFFFLSAQEAETLFSGNDDRKASGASWWLRSPYARNLLNAGAVAGDGWVNHSNVNSPLDARPAFNLNLSSVLFTSEISSESSKSYKLTMKDNNLGISVTTGKSASRKGDVVTIPYTISGSNKQNGTKAYVMVTDKVYTASDASALQCTALIAGSESGTGTFTLDSSITGTWGTDYHVYLLAVNEGGEKKTDYASTPVELSKPTHVHSFKYAAMGATITASCETPECDITTGLTMTISAPTNLTYNGQSKAATLNTDYNTTAFPNTYTISYEGTGSTTYNSTTAPTDAGDYKATVTVENVTAKVSFTITQTSGLTADLEGSSYTYDGIAKAITNTPTSNAAGGTTSYSYSFEEVGTYVSDLSSLTKTDAGTYTVYMKSTNPNYSNTATTTATLTINKADPAVTAPTAKTLTYTGSAQELVSAGSTNDGTMYYAVTTENKTPADNLYTTSIPTKTNAGTYYVWYKVKGDDNHTDTTPVCIPVTISAVETVTITFDAGGGTGSMAPVGIEKGSKFTFPTPKFFPPEDRVFAHWRIGEKQYVIYDEITVTADLTVTAVWKDDMETRIVEHDLTSVPKELEEKFSSITLLENALLSELSTNGQIASRENSVFQNVELQVLIGGEWVKATKENFPKDKKLFVTLPYPSGTGMNTHNFKVAHMFTTNVHSHQPGQIETPPVTKGESGITVELDGLSPVAVSWTKIDEKAIGSLPQTGDTAKPLLYGFLALIALVGLGLLIKKK